MSSRDLLYQLALTEVPHIGNVQAKVLLEHFSSAEAIFKASKRDLERIPNIGSIRAHSIKSFSAFQGAEMEMQFIQRYGITTLALTDTQYPQRLLNCADPPPLLFFKGVADCNAARMVAVVGTRNNTAYGKSFTESLVKKLASYPCIIVSGLAFGIDSIAHRSALKYDIPTIGVVGHGLDTIYPRENSGLAHQMLGTGGLLTEFRSRTTPEKHNFPSRNRIVAGITDATIIVESGIRGGSIITAELADGYHRDVFAVPGRSIDGKGAGCNKLIAENKAILLQDPEQFIATMGWNDDEVKQKTKQRVMFAPLTAAEEQIIELLKPGEPLSFDDLNFRLGMSVSTLSAALLSLEMQAILTTMPGKVYRLTDGA